MTRHVGGMKATPAARVTRRDALKPGVGTVAGMAALPMVSRRAFAAGSDQVLKVAHPSFEQDWSPLRGGAPSVLADHGAGCDHPGADRRPGEGPPRQARDGDRLDHPRCRFHTRFPLAMDICRKVVPEMRDFGQGHAAACHALDERAAA